MKVILYGGTSEGRILAEFCEKEGYQTTVHVATEYGQQLLGNLAALTGRMDVRQMQKEIDTFRPDVVVDATHPYAVEVSQNIQAACQEKDIRLLHLLRPSTYEEASHYDKARTFAREEDIVEYLKSRKGNVLLATGSKNLAVYTKLADYRQRLYVRALPSDTVREACEELGFTGEHLLLKQGPFSKEENQEDIKRCKARYLVTKESGRVGGFIEKLDATKEEQIELLVLSRPTSEKGYGLEQIKQMLKAMDENMKGRMQQVGDGGKVIERMDAKEAEIAKRVSILGMGPGDSHYLCKRAEVLLQKAGLLIGAERLLEPYKKDKPCLSAYKKEDIYEAIQQAQCQEIAVLVSGDSGFYSAGSSLYAFLSEKDSLCQVESIPGISSLSYMAAKIGRPWENAKVLSMHGRKGNVLEAVRSEEEVFVLTGGNAVSICEELMRGGFGDLPVYIGENLSYPKESIIRCSIRQAAEKTYAGLCVLWIINESGTAPYRAGIPEDAFIRTSVPMTKSEVRAVCLSKLALAKNAVAWDVGCGTGSVTVEMALQADRGRIYGIDKNPDAIALSRENLARFGIHNAVLVQGEAAEKLMELETPDAVFIGGSGGQLESIIRIALDKNPNVRIVCNMILLENLVSLLAILQQYGFSHTELIQIGVSKGEVLGNGHVMKPASPVYIVTAQTLVD